MATEANSRRRTNEPDSMLQYCIDEGFTREETEFIHICWGYQQEIESIMEQFDKGVTNA